MLSSKYVILHLPNPNIPLSNKIREKGKSGFRLTETKQNDKKKQNLNQL